MGDLAMHAPCCAANGFTEGDHDADCDDHPDNLRRRLARLAGVPEDTETFIVTAGQPQREAS